jgi:UDP-N-acetyl-D-mannosaminuronate dehydrogenase
LGSLNEKRILILGLSYRPGVKEDAFSGTYVLVKELAAHGARPFVLDPLYSETEMEAAGLEYCKDLDVIDGIILHTAHPDFLELNSGMFPNLTAVMDGRNFLKPSDWVQVTLLSL